MQFKPIPVDRSSDVSFRRTMRLNGLGSLFFHTRVILQRKRLTSSLHLPLCNTLQSEHLKHVLEYPRDHFKSTCAGEGLPTWRVLPLSQQDVDEFYKLGYTDEFIRYMLKMHNPDLRNILISENITNAAKLGRKIRWHYESNALYRTIFPETLPDTSCTWTDYSLHVKRPSQTTGGAHGEGTFDFLGVGSAIQSRHYNGILVQDDLVGRKAVESQSLMDKTIEYHQLLVGAFENEDASHENDELVIGNRWSYYDLNSYLHEHEPWFQFESHSALGGCCSAHPPDVPIFPEEFTVAKLRGRRLRLGAFNFSCQFLNNPANPEDAEFKPAWLNYFRVEHDPESKWKIVHEVGPDNNVRKDIRGSHLALAMTVDPNHSGNSSSNRCRHAIIVLARSEKGDYYLLDSWALAASYDVFYNKIFELAQKWRIRHVGLETIAAQRYIGHHIEHLNSTKPWKIIIDELKGEVEAPDGTLSHKKEWRIRNIISPIAEAGQLWVQQSQSDFISEYSSFPKGKYVDLLDAFAYAPQIVRPPVPFEIMEQWKRENARGAALVNQPYTYSRLEA